MAETAYVFECVGGCGAKTNGSQFCHRTYCPKMLMELECDDCGEDTLDGEQYCEKCVKTKTFCAVDGCMESESRVMTDYYGDMYRWCEDCGGWLCVKHTSHDCCSSDADTGVEDQHEYEKIMTCASNRGGSEEPISESKVMMADSRVDKEDDMLGLRSAEVSLKRKREDEMSTSKRVCVDDDSSNHTYPNPADSDEPATIAWLYHRLYQLIRLKNHGRGRGSDTQEEG